MNHRGRKKPSDLTLPGEEFALVTSAFADGQRGWGVRDTHKLRSEPGMAVHAYNPRLDACGRRIASCRSPWIHNKTLSQIEKKKKAETLNQTGSRGNRPNMLLLGCPTTLVPRVPTVSQKVSGSYLCTAG